MRHECRRCGRVDRKDVLVCTTVLLETEWMLRSVCGFAPAGLAGALRGVAGLPHVTLEDPASAARAAGWIGSGMDFADALHLAKAAGCEAFVGFDQRLAAVANALGAMEVLSPWRPPPAVPGQCG